MFSIPREALPGGGGGGGDNDVEKDDSLEDVQMGQDLEKGERAKKALEAQQQTWLEEENAQREILEKTMPPPVYPMVLDIKNLSLDLTTVIPGKHFFAREKKITKTVLKDINIVVKPGELLAIMGPTGCGKSTLLNVISGRVRRGLSGEITFNGKPRTKPLKRHIAYVLQDDIMFGTLTVEETLDIAARLRLPGTMSYSDKAARVLSLLDLLGLNKCKQTIIGDHMRRGVSGGERKRTNIGSELITAPSMLLLDEPTSGLDSSTAESILSLVKQYAMGGRTVITTIHQPSSRIFEMFDKLLLMADGKIVYFGPASEALPYFSSIGYDCPINYNPADFLLGLLQSTGNKSAREHLVTEYSERFTKDKSFIERQQQEASAALKTLSIESGPPSYNGAKYPTSWLQQFQTLLIRSFKLQRPKFFDKIPFLQVILVSVLVGLLWLRIPHEEKRITDLTAVIFFIAIFAGGFTPLLAALFAIPMDRVVVSKERASGSYNISTYFFAKNVCELPLQLIYPTIFVTIAYWMVGINDDPGVYFKYLGIVLLANFTSSSLGLMVGAIFLDIPLATLMATISMLAMMLVGGFFLHMAYLGWWIRWTQYLSFLRYLYFALLQVSLEGQDFKQQKNIISPYDGLKPIPGEAIVEAIGAYDDGMDPWADCLLLIGFAILFRILAFLAVRYLNRPKN